MGMSKEVSAQRRSILIRAFKQKPDSTSAEACAKVEEKFPGMGTPTSAIIAECRKAALSRQRAPREIVVNGMDHMKHGTNREVPSAVLAACRKLKPVLEEYGINVLSIHDGKVRAHVVNETESEL